MRYTATVDEQEYDIHLEETGVVTVRDRPYTVDLQSIDGGFHYSLLVGAASYEVFVERCQEVCFVTIEGHRYQVSLEDRRLRQRREQGEKGREEPGEAKVSSPMPGVVVAVLVEEGQAVKTGEGLAILEAMKMENEIRAPCTGVVQQVHVTPGQRVSQDEVLVQIGPPSPSLLPTDGADATEQENPQQGTTCRTWPVPQR